MMITLQGKKDVGWIVFLVFSLWDYIPIVLLLAMVVKGRNRGRSAMGAVSKVRVRYSSFYSPSTDRPIDKENVSIVKNRASLYTYFFKLKHSASEIVFTLYYTVF